MVIKLQNLFTFELNFSLLISRILAIQLEAFPGKSNSLVDGKYFAVENVGIGIKLIASVLVQVFNKCLQFCIADDIHYFVGGDIKEGKRIPSM